MSVVLFCALAYNRDLQGARCGYDCLAVSSATAVNNGVLVEAAYSIPTRPTGTGTVTDDETNHLNAGVITAEMTYTPASTAVLSRVVAPILEVSYVLDQTRFLKAFNPVGEVALWRYSTRVGTRLASQHVETAYTEDTSAFTTLNQGSILAEYSYSPLQPTAKPVVHLPLCEVAYNALHSQVIDNDPEDPGGTVRYTQPNLHCHNIFAEYTCVQEAVPGAVISTTARADLNSPVIEVCYGAAASTGINDAESNYAMSGLSGEIAYTPATHTKTAGVSSLAAEVAYRSRADYDETRLYSSGMRAEVTYSSWTGASSPAVQPWQVSVGNNPLRPQIYSSTVFVTAGASDTTTVLSMASGDTVAVCYSPANVVTLWGDLLVTYCNQAVTLQDTATLDCTYVAVGSDVVDMLVVNNALVLLYRTGKLGVLAQYSQDVVYYDCPTRGTGIVYDSVTRTYCISTSDNQAYFISAAYAVTGSVDLGGEIVQLQASQYGTTPCFVFAVRGTRAIVALSAVSHALLAAVASDGLLVSGIYSKADVSFIAAKSDSASVFKARTTMLWTAQTPAIQGLPKHLTIAGSRVYFVDGSTMTAGWI